MADGQEWDYWANHILKELERLNDGQAGIMKDIQDIKNNQARVAVIEDQIHDIREWKGNVTEVFSTTQLSELKKEVEQLKAFKIRFITIWAVVQFVISIGLALLAMG